MLNEIEHLEFRAPTLEDAEWAVPLLLGKGYKSCELSFATIYIWRKYYDNQIARLDNGLLMRSGTKSPLYMMPVVPDDKLKQTISALLDYSGSRGEVLRLFGTDEHYKGLIDSWFPGIFDWMKSPPDFDYIYKTSDLAELPGKQYRKKRQHVRAFSQQFDWEYEPIGDHNIDDVLDMLSLWCAERGDCAEPSLKYEHESIRDAADNMDTLMLCGGAIREKSSGKIVAMTLGSPISSQTFDINIEKALADYAGAYSVINQEFARRELLGKYEFINRENDLGLEGLRKAKLSYYPALILEKFIGEEAIDVLI